MESAPPSSPMQQLQDALKQPQQQQQDVRGLAPSGPADILHGGLDAVVADHELIRRAGRRRRGEWVAGGGGAGAAGQGRAAGKERLRSGAWLCRGGGRRMTSSGVRVYMAWGPERHPQITGGNRGQWRKVASLDRPPPSPAPSALQVAAASLHGHPRRPAL